MVFAALEAFLARAESGDMVMARPGTLGIVRECYSKWERRAPLTPTHVATLVKVFHHPQQGQPIVLLPCVTHMIRHCLAEPALSFCCQVLGLLSGERGDH